jgi:hypothetical protein
VKVNVNIDYDDPVVKIRKLTSKVEVVVFSIEHDDSFAVAVAQLFAAASVWLRENTDAIPVGTQIEYVLETDEYAVMLNLSVERDR